MLKPVKMLRRYSPILLMALAMAESAHAPLLGKASAANSKDNAARPKVADASKPPDPAKKPKLDLFLPSIPDASDPSDVKKKLAQLDVQLPKNPATLSLPWITISPNPQVSDPSNPTTSTTPTVSANLLAGGGTNSDSLEYWAPPTGPIQPYTGNGGFYIYTPQPVDPTDPVIHHTPTVTDSVSPTSTVAVPEPASLSLLITAATLLGRPGRKRA